MAEALLLLPEAPYPVRGGGPLRTASLVEFLAARFVLDVILFRQPQAPDPRAALPPGKFRQVWVLDLPHHSKAPAARISRNAWRVLRNRAPLLDRFSGFAGPIAACLAGKKYDLGVIEHFWCAPYQAQLRPHCSRLWLDLHNLESAWHATLADSESGLSRAAYRRFASACARLEAALLPRFDRILATSSQDADRARRLAPGARCLVYPNAIPLVPAPGRPARHAIVFTGNLEYLPNVGAVRYFRDAIWPALTARDPDLIWEVVGQNPAAVAPLLRGDPRIRLIGPVEDAIAVLSGARAAIAPLLAGSGTRLKILEAWAAVTPVVSTPLGAEGLACRSGEHLLLASSPQAFADSILSLLQDPPLAARIGAAGRNLYERCYTWEQAWTALETE